MYKEISAAFVSLRFRDYRLLWLGQFSTSMGMWMDNVARGWLMYELTGSPFMLGLTGAAKAAPMLFFGLLAGVMADRYGKKHQLMISQASNGLVNLLLALLVVSGKVEPWHILATGLLAGTAQAFQQPARTALISDYVEEKHLANAIALNALAFNISRTLGPMLAGILVALVGVGSSYFFQAAIYLLASYWTARMAVPAGSRDNAKRGSMAESLMEGLRYIRSDKTILALMALVLVPSVLQHPYISLMPIFAKDIMEVGPEGLGLLMGAIGFGSVTGALLAATVYRERHRGPLLLANAIVFAAFLGLFAFTPRFAVALPFLAVVGLAQTGHIVLANTLIQTLTPRHLRGRVMGVYFLDRGMMPLGTLLAGSLAGPLGAPLTVGIMAASGVLLPLWVAIAVPRIRQLH
ncbi:MAG: Enterobactin exporter EntS [Dehalococcoidia bacterium]|nr:Enterobactin exporter EntS [Dehalococcoidia bacterium]